MTILTIFLSILSVICVFRAFWLYYKFKKLHMKVKFELANAKKQLEDVKQENKDLNKIRRTLEHQLKEIEIEAFRNDYDNLKIAINKIRELIRDRKFKD